MGVARSAQTPTKLEPVAIRRARAWPLPAMPANVTVHPPGHRPADADATAQVLVTDERTGDLVPIYYLVEKFIKPRDGRQEAALAQLPALAEQLQAMLKQAGMA